MKQRTFLRAVLGLWHTVVLSHLIVGIGGAFVVSNNGWALVMGLAIITGNTEPVRPELAYPWSWTGCATVVCVVGFLIQLVRRRQASSPRVFLGATVAYLGSLAAALVPFLHLARLWSFLQGS